MLMNNYFFLAFGFFYLIEGFVVLFFSFTSARALGLTNTFESLFTISAQVNRFIPALGLLFFESETLFLV